MLQAATDRYGVSIQASLSGYSFTVTDIKGNVIESSGTMNPETFFSSSVLSYPYRQCRVVYSTPKFTLVPKAVTSKFSPETFLYDIIDREPSDSAVTLQSPFEEAVLVCVDPGMDRLMSALRSAGAVDVVKEPEAMSLLRKLRSLDGIHNRVVASYRDGLLTLAVAEADQLLLCNSYEAFDFTTAVYYIFMALKQFQFNPELTTLYFLSDLTEEQQMVLYNYFNGVELDKV